MTFGPGGGSSVSTDCSGIAFLGLFLVFGGIGGASKGETVMTGFGCCGQVCGLVVADSCVGGRVDCVLFVSGRGLVGGGTFPLCSCFSGNVM